MTTSNIANAEHRFLLFIGLCFSIVLMSAFMATYSGVIDLQITAQIRFSDSAEFLCKFGMFMLNLFFAAGIILRIRPWKALIVAIVYAPIHAVLCLVFKPGSGYDFVITVLIPFGYIVAINSIKRYLPFKSMAVGLLIFIACLGLFQQLTGFIKLQKYGVGYFGINSLTLFIYSADQYLFLILYYVEVIIYGLVGLSSFRLKANGVSANAEADAEIMRQQIASLNAKGRFIFKALAVSYYLFQLFVVLLIGFINNTAIEIFIMLGAFFAGRCALGKSWHSKKLSVCSLITFAGFYVLTKTTLPVTVSLFSCIALSSCFVWLLYQAALKEDEFNALKKFKSSCSAFDLKTCTEVQLKERCRLKNIPGSAVDFCVSAFYDKKSNKELAGLYSLELQSVKNKKRMLLQRLTSTF